MIRESIPATASPLSFAPPGASPSERRSRRGAPWRVAEIAGLSLDQFARAGLILTVDSRLLGETVLFASDNASVPAGETRAVYRALDLRRLLSVSRGASTAENELRP